MLLAALLLALALAACGTDDDAADPPPDPDPADEGEAADDPPGDDAPEQDDAPDVSFEGETITLMIGHGTGGGFDAYGRILARHLGKHLPGNPEVIVDNNPGPPVTASHIYNVAEPDGLTLGLFVESLVLSQALDPDEIDVDMRGYEWVGSISTGFMACAVRTDAGVDDIRDWIDSDVELTLGASGIGSNTYQFPAAIAYFTGGNVNIITGYDSTGDTKLAIDSGELDGGCWDWDSISTIAREWFTEDFGPDFAMAFVQGPEAHPQIPDVPIAHDLLDDPEEARLMELVVAYTEMTKPVMLPPGTPPEIVQVMRDAFLAALADPDLLAEAEQADLPIDPTTGERVAEVVEEMLGGISEEDRAILLEAVN